MSDTTVTAAVDPLPEVTEGIKLIATVVTAGTQVDKEMNTPAMVDAAIEDMAQAAKDRLQKAILEGDMDTLRKMLQ